MKKFLYPALFLSFLVLAGCQTTLPAYKPGATQLVVPLANEKDEGATPFGSYYAVITDAATGKEAADVRLAPSEEFALERTLAPGSYYISQTYFQFTQTYEKPDSERKFYDEDFAPFTMEEGKITLCPVVFSTSTVNKGALNMSKVMDLSSYKDKGSVRGEEVLRLLEVKYPDKYSSWK